MEIPRPHSQTGQVAYHDLLRLLKDQAVSDLRGAPVLKQVNGRGYWYDRYRVGTRTVDRYIGDDTEDLRARLDRAAALKAADAASARERARLVRLLRAEGYMPVDLASGQILTAMARAGVFRLGGTLVGTQAFRLYEGELGVRIAADQMAMTMDIDVASFERLSLVLDDRVDPDLPRIFRDFDFDPVPGIGRAEDVWRWRQTTQQTLIEFLTPSFDAEEGIRELPALGVKARALHHLNYLIADPLPAAVIYRQGALVQVPQPARYAIHKLIVADRRREGADAMKARKDRAQAAFLVDVLAEEDPDALGEALEEARGRGTAWRTRIDATLARLPETAARLTALPG
ncbi:MAG: GSU2403 family nucleotidyltransferase fold protein [Pseudomonadota bacterium]